MVVYILGFFGTEHTLSCSWIVFGCSPKLSKVQSWVIQDLGCWDSRNLEFGLKLSFFGNFYPVRTSPAHSCISSLCCTVLENPHRLRGCGPVAKNMLEGNKLVFETLKLVLVNIVLPETFQVSATFGSVSTKQVGSVFIKSHPGHTTSSMVKRIV